MTTKKEIFHRLSTLDVSQFIEKKQNLDYISWSTVQHILCSLFERVDYRVVPYEDRRTDQDNVEYLRHGFVHPAGTGGALVVQLSIDGCSHTEVFPVMDNKMKSKSRSDIDARDVSDSIKRAYVKAAAHFGLGLGLYDKSDELPHPKRIEHELRPQAERFAEVEETLEAGGFTKAGLRDLYGSMAKDEQEHFKARVVELGEGLDD